jgi:hypothetical protein
MFSLNATARHLGSTQALCHRRKPGHEHSCYLRNADEAGLVENDAHGKPVLKNELTIKPCSPDRETRSNDELDWSLEDSGSSGNGDI